MTLLAIEVLGVPQAKALFVRKARFARNLLLDAGREMFGEVKADINQEIRGQFSLHDNRKRWPVTKEFGRLPAGRPALRSYAGKWASAPVTLSDAGTVMRTKIKAPGAGAHVGGKGLQRSQRVTAIRARGPVGNMQSAIFRKTGARVSRRTLLGPGLQLLSRPHANPSNPVTALKVTRVLERRFEAA